MHFLLRLVLWTVLPKVMGCFGVCLLSDKIAIIKIEKGLCLDHNVYLRKYLL